MAVRLVLGLIVIGCQIGDTQPLTHKQIFDASIDAVVVILINGQAEGTGFIVSPTGMVVTANHVVTTEESNYSQYSADIKIVRFVNEASAPSIVQAVPLAHDVGSDTALLKITGTSLPFVSLGNWKDVEIGDELTLIPFVPHLGRFLVIGIASAKAQAQKVILFQAPVRRGFSGSPVFDARGRVVGLVSTKVFGIGTQLEAMKKQMTAAANNPNVHAQVIMQGADVGQLLLGLTNVLDQQLISGLGTAVGIDSAKEMKERQEKTAK